MYLRLRVSSGCLLIISLCLTVFFYSVFKSLRVVFPAVYGVDDLLQEVGKRLHR
jgi:hypothetical protein